MPIDNVSAYATLILPTSSVKERYFQKIGILKKLQSVSHDNIEIPKGSANETLFDYLFQARKYYVENKQNHKINAYDKLFLQDLVDSENVRKPGLNIKLSNSPAEFASEMKSLIQTSADYYRGQCIVNMGSGPHFAALDIYINGSDVSIIGVEPATLNNMGPSLLLFRLLSQMKTHVPTANVVMLESNIQQSPVDCAIFSLHFALKMYAAENTFSALHKKHIAGALNKNIADGVISSECVDKYLPVAFMKHANSKKRLHEYFNQNQGVAHISENKKGIIERQRMFIFERGERTYSASIEDKRIKLIERAIKRVSIKKDH